MSFDTEPLAAEEARTAVRRFQLTVVEGTRVGVSWESTADRCSLGSHASNDFVIEDPSVSRFHSEIRVDGQRVSVADLGSRNGTAVDGVAIEKAYLRDASIIRMGRTAVRFNLGNSSNWMPLSERTRFGSLVGNSVGMRMALALLERAAQSDTTILIEGETG